MDLNCQRLRSKLPRRIRLRMTSHKYVGAQYLKRLFLASHTMDAVNSSLSGATDPGGAAVPIRLILNGISPGWSNETVSIV